MIDVRDLTKRYGTRDAVREVSFSIGVGEIVGFLGPNGAGKTTTLRMLTGFLPPTGGVARVAGYDVVTQSMEVRARIGYLPESVPLYRDLSVAAYLDFVGVLKGIPRSERARRIASVEEACGIGEVRTRRIGTLSRGFRQRVGIEQKDVGQFARLDGAEVFQALGCDRTVPGRRNNRLGGRHAQLNQSLNRSQCCRARHLMLVVARRAAELRGAAQVRVG